MFKCQEPNCPNEMMTYGKRCWPCKNARHKAFAKKWRENNKEKIKGYRKKNKEMLNFYVSFGQIHTHSILVRGEYRTFDKDCIALIYARDYQEARGIAFRAFESKFSNLENELPDMSFYPRGVIPLT